MKINFIIVFTVFVFSGFFNSITANDKTDNETNQIVKHVAVSFDIYALSGELSIDDYSNVIKNHEPESTPALIVKAGEPGVIKIGDQDINGNSIGMTRIKFSPNKSGTKFDLDFELMKGTESNIGSAEAMKIGSVFLMSVNLNNVTKLIRVTTKLHQEPVNSYSVTQENKQACGRVSIFILPPSTKNLYRATVSKVDDDNSKRDRNSFKLPLGKHTVYIHELINDPDFTRRGKSLRKAKSLEINVEENVTYHLAAKFIRSKRLSTYKGKYWEPVVWKTTEVTCTL